MKKLKWFFPVTLREADELFTQGYRPHGGGTFLSKTPLNIPGLFTLSGISELKKAYSSESGVFLGAALSYSDAAEEMDRLCGETLTAKALRSAASTPLRNRITLGGSIYALPSWSDLLGPLLLSETSLLMGPNHHPIPLHDYLSDRKLKDIGLISSIHQASPVKGEYFRFTKTRFDYPCFTISLCLSKDSLFSAVVTGTEGRYLRLDGSRTRIITDAGRRLAFPARSGFSSEYLKERALVQIERMMDLTGEEC